jgi:hypothetical protein
MTRKWISYGPWPALCIHHVEDITYKSKGHMSSIFLSPAASCIGSCTQKQSVDDCWINEQKQIRYTAVSEKCHISATDQMLQRSGGWIEHTRLGTSRQVEFELSSHLTRGEASRRSGKMCVHSCVPSLCHCWWRCWAQRREALTKCFCFEVRCPLGWAGIEAKVKGTQSLPSMSLLRQCLGRKPVVKWGWERWSRAAIKQQFKRQGGRQRSYRDLRWTDL